MNLLKQPTVNEWEQNCNPSILMEIDIFSYSMFTGNYFPIHIKKIIPLGKMTLKCWEAAFKTHKNHSDWTEWWTSEKSILESYILQVLIES